VVVSSVISERVRRGGRGPRWFGGALAHHDQPLPDEELIPAGGAGMQPIGSAGLIDSTDLAGDRAGREPVEATGPPPVE